MRRDIAYLIILLALVGLAFVVARRRWHAKPGGDRSLRIDLFKGKDDGEA